MVTLLACSSLKMAMDVFIHVGAIFCSWARLSRVGALPTSSLVSICKYKQLCGHKRCRCFIMGLVCVRQHHWSALVCLPKLKMIYQGRMACQSHAACYQELVFMQRHEENDSADPRKHHCSLHLDHGIVPTGAIFSACLRDSGPANFWVMGKNSVLEGSM